MDGHGTKRLRNIAENFNRLSRVHERYRQTDDRQTEGRAYSKRSRSLKRIESIELWAWVKRESCSKIGGQILNFSALYDVLLHQKFSSLGRGDAHALKGSVALIL